MKTRGLKMKINNLWECPYIVRYRVVMFTFLLTVISTPILFAGYKYNYDTKEWNYVNKGDRYRYNVASDKWEYKPKKTKTKYNSMYGKWSWEIDKK